MTLIKTQLHIALSFTPQVINDSLLSIDETIGAKDYPVSTLYITYSGDSCFPCLLPTSQANYVEGWGGRRGILTSHSLIMPMSGCVLERGPKSRRVATGLDFTKKRAVYLGWEEKNE